MIPQHPPTSVQVPPGSVSSSLPATTTMVPSVLHHHNHHRGAFILFEGIDRCGKTTQCTKLLNRLISAGIAATILRFPDRTTSTGMIIHQYLQSGINVDDHAIHLLFSANRWENSILLQQHLLDGTTVICDRYAYSGVAFSSAKVHESNTDTTNTTNAQSTDTTTESLSTAETTTRTAPPMTPSPLLDLQWCIAPDRGLPAPDCILFLDISQEDAEKRGGFGEERYEKRDMQLRVREQFRKLQQLDEGMIDWNIINAAQTIEQVEDAIWDIASTTVDKVKQSKSRNIPKLWTKSTPIDP